MSTGIPSGGGNGVLLTTTNSVSVTNKSISSSDITLYTDTYANLTTYAATGTNGELVYASDRKKYYGIKDSALVEVGSAVGDSSIYQIFDGESGVSSWDTTGITNATFTQETSSPLNGSGSYKLTNHASAATEEIQSPSITLATRSKAKTNSVRFQYTYDGTDEYIRAFVYDVTNATELAELLLDAKSVSTMASIPFVPLSTTATIELRFDIQTGEAADLIFDDVEFSDDPFVYKNLNETQELTFNSTTGFTVTGSAIKVDTVSNIGDTGTSILSYANVSNSTVFTAIRDCTVNVSSCIKSSSTSNHRTTVEKNATGLNSGITSGGSDFLGGSFATMSLAAGEYFEIKYAGSAPTATQYDFCITATAQSEHIITPKDVYAPVKYTRTSAQSIPNNASPEIIDYATKDFDNDSLVSTGASWAWTAPKAGTIFASAFAQFDSTASWNATEVAYIDWYKNGTRISILDRFTAESTTTQSVAVGGTDTVEVEKGDTIDFRIFQNTGGALNLTGNAIQNYASIFYIDGGSSAIGLPTTPPCAIYTRAASAAQTASAATLTYDTVVKDTHGAYSSGVFTVPETGIYYMSASVFTSDNGALNETIEIQFMKNTSTTVYNNRHYHGGSVTGFHHEAACSDFLSEGDTIEVQVFGTHASSSWNVVANGDVNRFSIYKIGL